MAWAQETSDYLCDCGCGEFTLLAGKTDRRRGHVKGEPLRFLSHHHNRKSQLFYVVDDRGCWVWQRALSNGYGRMRRNGKNVLAHRWYWEQANGRIPEGFEIDHVCRNTTCVNPHHLRLATHAENGQNRSAAGKGSSRFRGVSWSRAMGRWLAFACPSGQIHRLGYFEDEEEAARVAAAFRREHMPFSLERSPSR
jgi:HNH endonuclease